MDHRLFAILALCLCCGGCTMGPDFHSPAQETARRYSIAVPQGKTAQSRGPGGGAQHFEAGAQVAADWYTLFRSPRLDKLIRQALANNPSLQAGQASLRKARYQLESAAGSSLPDVDASAGAGRQRGNGAQIGLDSPLFSNVFNLFTARLSLGYDLDLFGASAREIEARAAQVDYQQALLRGSTLTLIDNVVVTTVQYAALSDRLAANRMIIESERDQLELLTKQEQAGAVTYGDVLRARALLADSEASLPALRHELAVTRHTLARLIGADPGTFTAPHISLKDFHLPATLPLSLPSAIVRQRPDVLAAEQLLHVASAEIGMTTAHLYPDIRLTADFGSAANHSGDLLKSSAQVWGLGASLVAPLFHGHSLRANVKAAKAEWEQQYARYRETVLTAFTQVADVLDAISEDAASLEARDHALTANKDSLELVRNQYSAGSVDYLDVLTAEEHYNQALLAHIDAASRRYVDTASLYHSLGGGWWNDKQSHPH